MAASPLAPSAGRSKMDASWIDKFAGLSRLPEDIRSELEAGSQIVTVPAGKEIFEPGQTVDNLLLLLEGTVKVQQRSDTGREVFLYRVHAGLRRLLCRRHFRNRGESGGHSAQDL